ncbi:inositolphosphotransferase [Martiniozyma asiatica (nom. inval.)]|nr:inositolphosphotransferase [Martiniozyma asiatica]
MFSLFEFIKQAYKAVCNNRPFYKLIWLLFVGFLPVFLWLLIFKNAGSIPKDIRPIIHIKMMHFSILQEGYELESSRSSLSTFVQDEECNESHDIDEVNINNTAIIDNLRFDPFENITHDWRIQKNNTVFLVIAWPLLNILFWISPFQAKWLDFVAFFSYVICHLAMPIVCAVYIYLVHPPGDLARFSFNLGIQNIFAVLTHLLFPTSPPWFIHLNGINAHADYDTLGYAAGLTRIDSALGSNLATNGFHKSPIVFGACPSVHSAMVVCCFIWVAGVRNFKIKGNGKGLVVVNTVATIIVSFYLVMQWWATMYLDHHWRIDLYVGMLYSIGTRVLISKLWPLNVGEASAGLRLFGETRLRCLFA